MHTNWRLKCSGRSPVIAAYCLTAEEAIHQVDSRSRYHLIGRAGFGSVCDVAVADVCTYLRTGPGEKGEGDQVVVVPVSEKYLSEFV